MESLSLKAARRLALARAGLLREEFSGLPSRAAGRGKRALARCRAVIGRFGYLQLDTISVSGARTQGIVLCSRLEGLPADLPETLLQPGRPYFEYWGHEACWIPIEFYRCFEFRRVEFRTHPWWGDVLDEHRPAADALLRRIAIEGPVRSIDLEAPADPKPSATGMWETKLSKRIAEALWSAGELAIRERRNFQRSYDLPERVIPQDQLDRPASLDDSLDTLLRKALDGHGWATTGTLAATWRLRNRRDQILASLRRLEERGEIRACELRHGVGRIGGWIAPADLELAARLQAARLHVSRPVLLSPFDPVLWDRPRVKLLFDFDQVLEIYKPKAQRRFGYYCLPVLAGERLIGRVDLKAERATGRLEVRARHSEPASRARDATAREDLISRAIDRFAATVDSTPVH